MAEKVNLQQKIQQYRQANPKLKNLSDEKILSIMVKNGVITLTEEEQRSVFGNNKPQNNNMGLQVEKTVKKTNPQKTIYLQSGRKVVYSKTPDEKLVMKYYGTDGTQLNPDYFKKVEGQISISEDGKTYTITKDGKKTTLQAKDPSKGAIDQNLARLNNEEKRLKKTKKEQGVIGKSWDWIKNTTGIGDGSDKAQKQIEAERKLLNQIKTGKISKKDFKEVTGVEYSKENLEKFKRGELSQATAKIDGYKEGQEMASDVAGDMISGIAAVGIYTAAVAAAPFTGGASIAVGVVAATASGALIKAGVKALDTVGTDRKYTLKDFGHDSLTGGFSGLLAPITGGMGGAVGKTVATKLGIQAVKQVGKEVAEEVVEQGVKQGVKQGLKTALTNPTGYEYVGGTLVKRGTALAAEMATDGALGGAIDGGFRAGLDNDWDADAIIDGTIEGGVGGALMAPIIGVGFKVAGKGGQKLGEIIKRNKGANEVAEVAISKEIVTGEEGEVVSHANNKTNDINSNAKSKENPAMVFEDTPQSKETETVDVVSTKESSDINPTNSKLQETMSDAEFEELKSQILENPNFPRSEDRTGYFRHKKFTRIDKDNILFAKELLGNSELTNILDEKTLSKLINNFGTNKNEASRILLQKLKNNPDLLKNSCISEKIGDILSGINSIKSLELVDKLFSKPETLENLINIDKILSVADNDYSIAFAKKILENPKLLQTLNFIMYLPDLIKKCDSDITNNTKLELFNEFIKNPQNMSDVELSNAFARSIHIGHNKVFDLRNKANKLSLSELKTLELNSEKSLRSDLYENLFLELSKNEKFKDISSKYYDLYLENEFKECSREDATRYREMCKSIDKEYGVKVILPANLKEVGQSLILVYQELNNYKMHSNNQAKMPPVLDFMYPLADNAAGMAHIRDGINQIDIRELSTSFIKHSLRHEMAHINDIKQMNKFPSEIRSFKNEPKKDFFGELVFDVHTDLEVDKCKYVNELRKGGISEKLIEYAYTNPLEFVAVASQGDFSKYSLEFKKYLTELGMPEWMLSFSNPKPYFISRGNKATKHSEIKIQDFNTEVNSSKNPAMIVEDARPNYEVKMHLKENEPIPIEKAKSMLSELGFPKDEIDALDFDNNSLTNITYIHFILKEKLATDFKDVDFSNMQATGIRRDIYSFLKEEPNYIAKYMSTDNIEELKKYVQFDIVKDFENIADALENDLFKEHYDDFMGIIPILTKNGTVKMTPEQFKELRWVNESCLPLITPERAAFVDKVNSKVPDEYKLNINNFEYLGDTETLTDNLVSGYVNEVNRFLNHNINDETRLWGSNLKNKIAQMKEISDFLDKYPVELGRNEKGLISSHKIESIMQRPDIKKIQKLLSEMTPEARRNVGVDRLPDPESDIPFDKWRDFYNFISEGTLVEGSGIHPYQFIDYVESHNIKDLDSFAKYMHELKNTYAFAYDFQKDRFFNVLNEDYKGASALLKEIRSLTEDNEIFDNFITYAWEYIINDKNIDFKKALASITTLKKQGVEVLPSPDVWYIIKSKDPKNIIEKFKIMKQSGFEMEYCAAEHVFDNPEISPKQLQDIIDNFEEQLSMKYGNTVDIDIVRHAALMSNSGSTIIGLTSKNGLYDHQWETIINNCCCSIKDDNKIFYDELWNNPKAIFNKRSLVYLAQYVNKENSDLAIKICSNKDVLNDFSYYGVCRLLKKINKDNNALVDKLIFDKEVNFSKWKLTQILENENKYALELLDLVCYNKELDFPIDKINFIVDCKISSEISPLVLAEKTKKFFDLGLDDDFIKDILKNSESLTFYSDEVLKILKQRSIDDPKTPLKDVLKALVGNTPDKLQDRIDTLILLAKFTDEEVAIFKKQGVDVNYRMEQLEKLINAKHDLISTTQSDINTFLKSIANTQVADDVIRNADFEQFGKNGIQLQYSREEFIKRMNELSGGDFSRAIQRAEDVGIPTLKMSQDDIVKSKEALEKYKNQYMNNTKEYNVIIDGKETKVTRFCGSQRGGSNEGDFAQIGDKLYYIKFPDETKLEQSIQEVMASELYRAAGIDAPNMKVMFDQNGNILGMASEYIPNIESEAHGNTLFDSFIADAWLADWDAPKHGNSVMRNGTCLKMDVGGSMDYRARGTKKDDFGNIVNELTSLIEQNGDYYSMTKGDVISSLKHVTNVSDEQVWKIIENVPAEYRNYTLGQKMLTRRDFIKKFETIFEQMDETKYNNILDMINDAKLQTIREFDGGTNVASLLGYEQTALGFEGLLNTRDLSDLKLKPQELATAQKMIHEIENFTKFNRVADNVPLPNEAKNFLNSILKGIPEFAAYFSKPQHSGTKYSLDVHILKVLQDSLKDPDYAKLSDQDKFVLKFSTLLHDIGKRYLGSNSDTGHASLSAEYVYSILDRFKLSDDMKDRIISIVENHHWFKDFNNSVMDERTIATLARRPQDWLIYKIMAKADLINVSEDFAIKHVKDATTINDLSQAFDKQVATIEERIKELREKQVVVTSTQWVDVPERVTSNGRKIDARTFDRKTAEIDGVNYEFKVLNLNEKTDNEDMFKYGFNHLKRKDLRFIIHMPGDGSTKWFNVFKTLAQNPLNNSAQSLSMISVDDTSTYCGRMFGFILDVNNANISHAYYSNTGSGTGKGLQNFVHELFEDGHHRSYVKDQFVDFLKTERGVEIDDNAYAKITEYIMNKKFPETQLKGNFTIDGKIYKADDILDAFTFSRDQLIKETKEKTHGSHNEMVGLNAKVKGLIAKVNTFEELPEYFLRFAKENNLPIILMRSM